MALQLSTTYETPFGLMVPGTYWRWVGFGVELVPTPKATVVLRPFLDQAAADAGKAPIGPDRQYTLTGADVLSVLSSATQDALNAAIYTHIREKDEYFRGAADA